MRAAEAYVRACRGEGHDRFYTGTARRIARADELVGGSVYFVRGGFTLFRMPFVEVERRSRYWWVAMRPEIVRVEALKVGFLRGRRYLEGDRAPKDLPASMPADLADAGDRAFERIMAGGRA